MKNGKYFIVLFCDDKRDKILYRSKTKETIIEKWRECKTQKKPKFLKLYDKKRNHQPIYRLALIFPNHVQAKKVYIKDELGRNKEVHLDDDKIRVKEIIPYWKEERIFDHQIKKHIRYHEMMEKYFYDVREISQIFTLNNKLFLQTDNEIKLFGNKNIHDAERLFEIVREDLLSKRRGNFIFVKDVSTAQRKNLYILLEGMGYKRTELFRHYSY